MPTKQTPSVDADAIAAALEQAGLPVVDRFELPARPARFEQVPAILAEPVRRRLASRFPAGIYAHQAVAVEALIGGQDVCLATSTASGKSLAFMSAAAHIMCDDRNGRVLALYPARALIQDQIEKWRAFLDPLDLEVGLIDGGVPTKERPNLLRQCHVILMTPDVAHAWLLGRIGERSIGRFLDQLRLLILDEAHVYDGVFGTNMAYLMRRLDAVTRRFQLIVTTATLGGPGAFVERLTGRSVRTLDGSDDGSPAPKRLILLSNGIHSRSLQLKAEFLRWLAHQGAWRFLAFGDSRRMVEQLVVMTKRRKADDDLAEDTETEEEGPGLAAGDVLPYRAGYETEDRNEIQAALGRGTLAGVVSTSAMELGLDIGEIDIVVLLNPPWSTKSFWQRTGRTGRTRPGVCVLIDDRGVLIERNVALLDYTQRDIEPNWLYLDNRYIQYANALCAAHEHRGAAAVDDAPFTSLPSRFRELLANELNPAETVSDDLYVLKQRAQAGPHYEFPLRTGIEPNFQVLGPFGRPLGSLTYGQVLREAYPGGIYYYMATPYRVRHYDYRRREIRVARERYLTTRPLAQTMVFPRFDGGILGLRQSEDAFVAEAEVQVSERVLGFTEIRGSSEEQHVYGADSSYARRELTRFFPTTGVCWYLEERRFHAERLAAYVLEAYCATFGVQSRDVGGGLFHANSSPLGPKKCQGMCIFDATHGSLRLTQRLCKHFADVVEVARSLAESREDHECARDLESLRVSAVTLPAPLAMSPVEAGATATGDDYVTVIAPGSVAMLVDGAGTRRVTVRGHRYTPRGLLCELDSDQPGTTWLVNARNLRPIYGESMIVRLNLVTGDLEPVDS